MAVIYSLYYSIISSLSLLTKCRFHGLNTMRCHISVPISKFGVPIKMFRSECLVFRSEYCENPSLIFFSFSLCYPKTTSLSSLSHRHSISSSLSLGGDGGQRASRERDQKYHQGNMVSPDAPDAFFCLCSAQFCCFSHQSCHHFFHAISILSLHRF